MIEVKLPSREYLKGKIQYDPETGLFWWPKPKAGTKRGKPAGHLNTNGYVTIKIDGYPYKAHQLAWVYMTGEWPSLEIDHINRNRSDNRWNNLRHVSKSLNMANSKVRKDSTTGFKGVYLTSKGRWKASICKDKKTHHLGYFDSKEEAGEAYKRAHKEVFKELYDATA